MSYNALHEKKSLSAQFTAMEKSCTAIPARASKVMRCIPIKTRMQYIKIVAEL